MTKEEIVELARKVGLLIVNTCSLKYFVICVAILSGCSTELHGNHVQGAVEFCQHHNGVARLWSDISFWHVQCMDGTRQYKVGEEG